MKNKDNVKHKPYKIRWLLLAGISIGAFTRQFTATAFAIVNDSVSQYFNVTNYQVDILSIGDTFLAVLVCLLLSICGKYVLLRLQCLLAISCSVIGNLFTAVAFTSRNFYICVILGRLLCGLATGILCTLPATFANKWFPPKEIATAFSITFAAFNSGGIVSSLLIPYLIPESYDENYQQNKEYEVERVGSALAVVFAIVTGLLTGVLIFFCIYARDRPPIPASEAEAMLSQGCPNRDLLDDLKSAVHEGLSLLKCRPFLLITVANFSSCTSLVLFTVLMPSLFLATFPSISSSTIGYLTAAAFCCATTAILLCGRILDKIGMYKSFSCFGAGLIVFFSGGIYLGHLRKHFVLLCVSYPLLFVSRAFSFTSFVEFLVEVTYPKNKTVVTSLFFAIYNLAFFATTSIERMAFNKCGPNCATLVSVFGNILTLSCLVFVKPQYKRSWANKGEVRTVA